MERPNAWKGYTKKQEKELATLCGNYIDFISKGKTERECVKLCVAACEEKGYRDMDRLIAEGKQVKAGDKLYRVCMNKSVVMFHIGKKPLESGMNILGAHIDSPRMDIKQNPLYEKEELAYLDTHYYGGIKKYQWVTLPLALHGVIVKKDGTTVEVLIGEDPKDPVFCVSDLLIHLAQTQMEKKANKVIEGENLDVLVGSKPLVTKNKEEKDCVKANILKLLKDKYAVEEEDFISAEIEVVPAGRARDCGLDGSMVMAYGQDDKVCAYTSMLAMLDSGTCEKTTCCLLTDKEEIGSVGATGMESKFFENSVAELFGLTGGYSELSFRRCLSNSSVLSSDVNAAYDPLFSDVFDKANASFFGKGMVFSKFTGSRGKSGSNDANAEYLARIRKMMDDGGICYQSAELGKVDIGGGGTIAFILSLYGMEVVDCGVAVLNMHAPWEITSKADIYECYRGYKIFLENA